MTQTECRRTQHVANVSRVTPRRGSRSGPRPGEPLRLIGYCRVSTDEQKRLGVSLPAQAQRLREYAASQGHAVLRIVQDDGYSGRLPVAKRPALAEALAAIRAGEADGLLFLKLDRLSRDVRMTLDLAGAFSGSGWQLVSVQDQIDTSTAIGKMILNIIASLAQMEVEQIGERVTMAMETLSAANRSVSRYTPFGFRLEAPDGDFENKPRRRSREGRKIEAPDTRPLVPCPAEQKILEAILAADDAGDSPWRIAGALNRAGQHNPRSGRPWQGVSIRAIITTARRREAILARRAVVDG